MASKAQQRETARKAKEAFEAKKAQEKIVVTQPVEAPVEHTLEQQAVEPQHVQPVTESPDIQYMLAQSLSGGIDSLPAPAAPEPEMAPVVIEQKAKGKRYAPVSSLANPNAVLIFVADQYHKEVLQPGAVGYLTYKKFALLIKCRGKTIKEAEEFFVANNLPRMKARNQIRWELERDKVRLGLPVEESKSEAAE